MHIMFMNGGGNSYRVGGERARERFCAVSLLFF
jgi:hypothetical protein